MKKLKKVLAIMVAFVLTAGLINLPQISKLLASAQTVTTMHKIDGSLQVKQELQGKTISVGDSLNLIDYVVLNNLTELQFIVYAPNGDILHNWSSIDTSYTFTKAGVYAVQYRAQKVVSSSEYYIYTDQYLIAVNTTSEEIELDATISTTAKTGERVRLPKATFAGFSFSDENHIKVFDAFGESVDIISNGDKSYITSSNGQGTYYIQYKYNGAYKYLTVTFGDDYSENVYKEVEQESIVGITLGADLKEIQTKGYVYLFKNYDLKASAKNLIGEDIAVTIKVNNEVKSTLLIDSFNGIPSIDASGNDYTITVSAEGFDDIVINAKAKFNKDCVKIALKPVYEHVVSELSSTFGYWNNIRLQIADGYNEEKIKEVLKLQSSADGTLSMSAKYTADGTTYVSEIIDNAGSEVNRLPIKYKNEAGEILTTYAIITDDLFVNFGDLHNKIDDNKVYNITFTIKYSYSINDNEDLNVSTTLESDLRVAKKSNDTGTVISIPKNIKIDKYDSIVQFKKETQGENAGKFVGSFVFPSATAEDFDNDGNKTAGVTFKIVEKGNEGRSYSIGSSIDFIWHTTGDVGYSATKEYLYYAVDASGNESLPESLFVTFIGVEDVTMPSGFDLTNVSITQQDNKYTITNSNSIDGTTLFIYQDDKAPTGATVDLSTKQFEFEIESNNFVAVFSTSNSLGRTYTALVFGNGGADAVDSPSYYQSVFNEAEVYKNVYTNDSVKVDIGTTVVLYKFYSNNLKITIPDGGLYKILATNQIVFLTTGKYIVEDGFNTSTITVVSGLNDELEYCNTTEIVKSLNNENKAEFVVADIKNNPYFGYDLYQIVRDTKGNYIEIKDGKFVVKTTDSFILTSKLSWSGSSISASYTVSTGVSTPPVVKLQSEQTSLEWNGKAITYTVGSAKAYDNRGRDISQSLTISVYDVNNNLVKNFTCAGGDVVIEKAGLYKILYTVIDEYGNKTVDSVNFTVAYPESSEDDGLAWYYIVLICVACVVVLGAVAWIIIIAVKNSKQKTMFINKAKSEKKEAKTAETKQGIITISESKDEKTWIVKVGTKVVSKENSKQLAIDKAQEINKYNVKIKVYNKQGRLIDSL